MSTVLRSSGGAARLGLPVTLSAMVHGILAVLVILAARTPRSNAVVYAVNLVAAPAGPRQVGIVNDATPAAEKAETPPPRRAEVQPKEVAPIRKPIATRRTTSRATPTPDAKSARFDTPAPKAGGGATGGQGTDVAGIRFAGKEFPYPGYLRNIVNQIAMRFDPRQRQLLSAEVQFVIRRDGSVFGISVLRSSGSYGFDLEAKGAIESAGDKRAFGPLPDGFSDDVLTVIFTFDPTIIR